MKQKNFNQHFVRAISSKESISNDLLSQIKDGPKLTAKRALEVYQEDYEARLTEALKNTYRAISVIIGDEDFLILSKEYIKCHPSVSSDLDDYGHLLSHFLKTHPLTIDYIFLSELAHFEWNVREVFHCEQAIGLSAIELMAALQSDGELVQLDQSARLLDYKYLITSLYTLKDSEIEDKEPFDFEMPQFILLYKRNSITRTHILSKNQAEILTKLRSPSTLQNIFNNTSATVTPEEIQTLFQFLGTERLILKFKDKIL